MSNISQRLFFALFFVFLCSSFHAGPPDPSAEPPKIYPPIREIIGKLSPDSIRATVLHLQNYGTRHTLSDTTSATRGIGAARRWIGQEMERFAGLSHGRMTVSRLSGIVKKSARIPEPAAIVDIIATLQPVKPVKTAWLLCAHYDSRCSDVMDAVTNAPGADDDGSGAAITIEIARVMAGSMLPIRTAVIFALVAGEEQGLYGSALLADSLIAGGWHINGVLNNDIVGNITGGDGTIESTYVRVFSEAFSPADTGAVFRERITLGEEYDGASRTLAGYIAEIDRRYVPDFGAHLIFRRDRFLRGGDQLSFSERGIAAIRFSEVKENFDRQHQDPHEENGKKFGDIAEGMNFAYCTNVARINLAAVASLACAPPPPADPKIVLAHLAYDTQLRWQRGDSSTAGFYILSRPTDTLYWRSEIFTRDTAISLQVSKDDCLFGIQAVDSAGNRSLVALPGK